MRTEEELKKHIKRCNCCKKTYKVFQTNIHTFNNIKDNKRMYSVIPICCTSYFCAECAEQKKRALYAKVKTCVQNETWRFLTLTTVKPEVLTDEFVKNCSNAINKLFTNLRKKFKQLKYIKVLEIGKNENLHYHILVNCYIDRAIIIKYWQKYTNAYIVDIRRAEKLYNVIKYIVKYIAKSFDSTEKNEFFYKTALRRFSFSHSCELPKKPINNWFQLDDKFYTFSQLQNLFRAHFMHKKGSVFDFSRMQLSESLIIQNII